MSLRQRAAIARRDSSVWSSSSAVAAREGAPSRVLSRQVEYVRKVEGIELGRFIISLNGNGVVYAVRSGVPNVTLLSRYSILSPEEARRLLPRGLLPSHIWGPARAWIESVSLYYSRDLYSTDIVQPIYSFKGTARGEQGASEAFSVSWPAVRPEYFAGEETVI